MNEGKYRRGVVKKILEGGERARVCFADYGISEVVPKTMVRNWMSLHTNQTCDL